MHKLVQQVRRTITAQKLLRPRQKVLVAVSGGVDSVVLLHVLLELAREFDWQLTVAHFNHKLRGREADTDEQFVRQLAKQLNLACVCGRGDVRQYARHHKLSIEAAARVLRHRFLARAAKRLGIPTVALAHHADDQVELFFVRLLRGAGGSGLAGMRWRSPSPADPQLELVRPLLDQPKATLVRYAATRKIPFRQDTSNFSKNQLRNRVRNLLLPWLKRQFGQGFLKTIPRLMELVGAEAEFAAAAAAQWLRAKRRTAFEKLPVAVQRQCVLIQLIGQGIEPDFETIEQLRAYAETPVTVSSELQLMRTRAGEVVKVPRERAKTTLGQSGAGAVQLEFSSRSGEARFNGLELHWRIQARRGELRFPSPPGTEIFDADRVGPGATLRHWQPGDKFQPIGMASPVKLQDIFTNLKIPAARRHQLVIAQTLAGEIFWVEGLRISEQFKVTKNTKRLLKWEWRKS
ncbi:MAG: tRNA lysidine(34) synthetase TilS [Verrucomicrobiae bacterium]|nr:tRNA lysidine(34) synthetase TilS [Verrucomicrobiae bacterium]